MKKLNEPSRRLFVRHFIGAVLLKPFLDLFRRQPGPRGIELRERVVRRAIAQAEQRRRPLGIARSAVIGLDFDLFIHGGGFHAEADPDPEAVKSE